jgi:hypothetical protein
MSKLIPMQAAIVRQIAGTLIGILALKKSKVTAKTIPLIPMNKRKRLNSENCFFL